MSPNLTENPRNRKCTKRGRKRRCNEAIHALRMRVERPFPQRPYGMKGLASTLITLRAFYGV